MKCPRCQKASAKPGYDVCVWCWDEVVFEGSTKRLKGRGYDLTETRRIALSLDPGVPSRPPATPHGVELWDPGIT